MKEKDRLMLTSILMAVAIVGSVITGVIGALSLTRQLTSRGRVVIITPPPPPELKFNVFEDVDCTVVVMEISWNMRQLE